MLKNLEIYVINLDRSKDRLDNMKTKLKKLNLNFTRQAAVDGKKTTFTSQEVNEKKYSLCHGKYITPTEVACYMSHYNTLKNFYENSDKDFALILEDDMEFVSDFKEILEKLLSEPCWDIVKLNGGHGGGSIKYKQIMPNYNLVLNLFHQSKSGAYLVNKKAAKAYVEKMLPMFVPFDHELVKYWKYKLNGFSLSPFPSWEGEDGNTSTIDYKMVKKNRKPFYKKLPTVIYKSYIAITRLLHFGK